MCDIQDRDTVIVAEISQQLGLPPDGDIQHRHGVICHQKAGDQDDRAGNDHSCRDRLKLRRVTVPEMLGG